MEHQAFVIFSGIQFLFADMKMKYKIEIYGAPSRLPQGADMQFIIFYSDKVDD
jgi:hypothetical protein